MVGIARVSSRKDQLVGVNPAAVLGRAVTTASHTHRSRPGVRPWQYRFEFDGVLPAVTEVVVINQLVTGINQYLIKAHVLLGDPRLAFVYLEGAQVMLGLGTVMSGPGAELVQVTVGPAERHLDNVVDLVEKQIRRQLKPPPQWRLGSLQIDPDAVNDDVTAARPPA
jgi:hypothetical protein